MRPILRPSRRSLFPLSFLIFNSLCLAAEFTDPAPPVLEKIADLPIPEAKPCPEVIFHAKPKPLPAGALTHDWTQFLGPTHNGVSTETKLLKKFPEGGPTLLWELKRGTGYASPAIQGDHLVYLHRELNDEIVECLRPEDGARYWRFTFPTVYADRYGYNNGPRCSPVIDADRVYIMGVEAKLFCMKLSTGQILWQRDLFTEFKLKQNFFGVGSTPLIEGNLLIINVGAPGGPGVIALDKLTGKMIWGVDDQWGPSYSSPVPADINGQRRVFVFAGGESRPATGGLLCIDPANGKLDFRYPWRSKTPESVNASQPVVIGNQVWISATYDTGGSMLTVKPDFTHELAWKSDDFGTHWNTSIHKNGYLYGFDGRHMQNCTLVCFEVKSGKEMWRKRIDYDEIVESKGQKHPMKTSLFRASLLSVDGNFLCLGEVGHLVWLDLTPEGCTELSRTWLYAADEAWSLPVLSHGLLYVNQNKPDTFHGTTPRLLCYDLRAAE